ncbi:hypothetical protein QE417_004050 [Mucilaginibacter terrae]|uniref:Uncharacterized protein n=1 Tax=Mucilaginibacter terrae TaxID=1955052 RepID=A0ABU3GYY3_9SPHI|nr:hypothetical protein [Mucilaginibacter terrae]
MGFSALGEPGYLLQVLTSLCYVPGFPLLSLTQTAKYNIAVICDEC